MTSLKIMDLKNYYVRYLVIIIVYSVRYLIRLRVLAILLLFRLF
jgi:hypothetical protein